MANGRREETLLHLSADGRVLEEINVVDAILKGGYHNVLLQGDASRPENELMDPIHLNDFEVVTNELAQRVPRASPETFSSRCKSRVHWRSSGVTPGRSSGA